MTCPQHLFYYYIRLFTDIYRFHRLHRERPQWPTPLQGFVFVHGIDPYVTANGVKRYEIALLGKGSKG